MFRCLLLVALPLLAVGHGRTWDPRHARLLGESKEGAVLYREGDHNDGHWECPWYLENGECAEGEFTCKCNDTVEVRFGIGCCYRFPSCGDMCNNWSCRRYYNCKHCEPWVKEWDMKACVECKDGFVFEDGLCDKDLNECAVNKSNGGCDHQCHNTYGSYYCTCDDGFRLNEDGHTCTRLACPALTNDSQVLVTPSDNWLAGSVARFEVVDRRRTLDGPEVARCVGGKASASWDVAKPGTTNTCNYVYWENAKRCPTTDDDVTQEACEQLGCCFDSSNAGKAPVCFTNPVKVYTHFAKTSPVPDMEKGFETYVNHSPESCAHKCQNTHDASCKTFGYKTTGRDEENQVEYHECYMLSKTKTILEDEGKTVENPDYDMYERVDFSHTS